VIDQKAAETAARQAEERAYAAEVFSARANEGAPLNLSCAAGGGSIRVTEAAYGQGTKSS
jgi:hypothetical protein